MPKSPLVGREKKKKKKSSQPKSVEHISEKKRQKGYITMYGTLTRAPLLTNDSYYST